MKEGYIPNITVNNINRVNKKNSLLYKSLAILLNIILYTPPKHIRLYIYIVYPADNIIEKLESIPSKGSFSKIPYKHINSPTKFKVKGAPQLPRQDIKNNKLNNGIVCAIPLYQNINLVLNLSYNIPPTHINKLLDINPCAKPNIILPSIPCRTLLNTPAKYTAACETELYAINSFISIILNVLILAYNIVIIAITNIIRLKFKVDSGNTGNINLNIP